VTRFSISSSQASKSWCTFQPLIALNFIIWGTAASIMTTIMYYISNGVEYLPVFILWGCFFLVSIILMVLYNFIQEKYNKYRMNSQGRNLIVDSVVFNFYSAIISLIVSVALFWLDFIPTVGNSSNFSEFSSNFMEYTINLFIHSPNDLLAYFLVYVASLYLYKLVCSGLNQQSANYVNMITSIGIPLAGITWEIVPQLKPVSLIFRFWYLLIVGLIFSSIGVILWWSWETNEKKLKMLKTVKVLNFEYFEDKT